MKYRCKCNNLGSPSCINNYCKECCNGINCNTHYYKLIECICKKKNYNKCCIDKKCNNCCNNKECDEHFVLCKCKKEIIKKNTCNTNSCNGKCCNDSHCIYHFHTGHEMTNNDFVYAKIILGSKHIIPTELINKIIDEYLDNRLTCNVCNYKFEDIESDISYGFAKVCFICNNWVCENCSSTSLIYGINETFCDFCTGDWSDSSDEY